MKHIIWLVTVICMSVLTLNADEAPYESFFSKKQNFDKDGTEIYSNNYLLKKHKHVGAGLSLGGVSGAIGINAELNLDPANSLVVGMGTGPSYGTFNVLGKYNFEAFYLSPYLKVGYSKWFSSGSIPSTATASDVLRQIFTERDLRAGKFDANFVVASIGAEYNQLEGELSGLNFYGEMTMLTETRTLKFIPTGAIGVILFY